MPRTLFKGNTEVNGCTPTGVTLRFLGVREGTHETGSSFNSFHLTGKFVEQFADEDESALRSARLHSCQ